MKKLILIFLACALFIASSIQPAIAAQSIFKIGNGTYMINDHKREDTAPYIKNGRTYLPLRYAAYAVGIGDNSIYWEGATKTAYLAKGDEIVSIRIGEQMIIRGNKITAIDAPAELVNGRTMLPLRAIAEVFGCDVEWDGKNQVIVTTE